MSAAGRVLTIRRVNDDLYDLYLDGEHVTEYVADSIGATENVLGVARMVAEAFGAEVREEDMR